MARKSSKKSSKKNKQSKSKYISFDKKFQKFAERQKILLKMRKNRNDNDEFSYNNQYLGFLNSLPKDVASSYGKNTKANMKDYINLYIESDESLIKSNKQRMNDITLLRLEGETTERLQEQINVWETEKKVLTDIYDKLGLGKQ